MKSGRVKGNLCILDCMVHGTGRHLSMPIPTDGGSGSTSLVVSLGSLYTITDLRPDIEQLWLNLVVSFIVPLTLKCCWQWMYMY